MDQYLRRVLPQKAIPSVVDSSNRPVVVTHEFTRHRQMYTVIDDVCREDCFPHGFPLVTGGKEVRRPIRPERTPVGDDPRQMQPVRAENRRAALVVGVSEEQAFQLGAKVAR